MDYGVQGLVVHYGRTLALDKVDLDVRPGRVVAVIGGDGAGKTTLLRALVGAVQPTAGQVTAPESRRIGFMPARAGTWAELTVDENIEFAAAAYDVTGADLDTRRTALLAATGLTAARSRTAAHLSGGMRQKLAFIMATLHRPDLVVLDEPTTGVDPVSRVDLWRMISRAAADGTAVVMATTYLDEAERAAYVMVLTDGQPLLSGPPDQIVTDVPGTVVRLPRGVDPARERPTGTFPVWRRGHERHGWMHDGGPSPDGAQVLIPDLEDAVIAASLAQEAVHE